LLLDSYLIAVFYHAKSQLFRSFNAIFSKIGRFASEEVVISLIHAKYLPVLLYGEKPVIYWCKINVP